MKVGIKSRLGSVALILNLVLVFRNIKNASSSYCYHAVTPTSNSSLPSSGISSKMGKPWYNKYNKTSNRKHKNSDAENDDYDKEEYKFAPFAEGKNRKTFATIKETAIAAINKKDKDQGVLGKRHQRSEETGKSKSQDYLRRRNQGTRG